MIEDSLKRFCLAELSKRDVSIPSHWKSCFVYDALVEEGAAKPVINAGPWMKAYAITAEGRQLLREHGPDPLQDRQEGGK